MHRYILTLSCADRPGIVAGVSQALAAQSLNIVESAQFGDADSQRFFMRVAFDSAEAITQADFTVLFAPVAGEFDMGWQIFDTQKPPRSLILVSKFDHCLMDLVYRARKGSVKLDIAAIMSNHQAGRHWAEMFDIPYHYWPGEGDNGKANRAETEAKLLALIEEENIELVVLARYMQILSPQVTEKMSGRIINIHHSFLPSFKGAEPYSRAYQRGVKMIGATAHFVTADLDEGPIITQGIAPIRHDMRVPDLVDVGREVEQRTLARAVRLYSERRVLLNGLKTVVFE